MESKAVTREQAESAAALWIARRECDDWSEAGERALQAWIAADTNHRAAWLRLSTAWQQTTRLRALKTTVPAGVVPAADEMHLPFFESSPKSDIPLRQALLKHRFAPGSYAVAAGLAVMALAAGAAYFLSAGPSYRTDIGALQSVALSDGSRVTLNTRTEIRVEVTTGERRIRLEEGEAYFEVAKDPSRPFIVEAGDKRIVAVGTQFSVRRDAHDIRVLVTEGSVRMEKRGQTAATATPNSSLLTAGTLARAAGEDVFVQQKPLVEVEQALSWRTGYLVFDRTPLDDAVAEFNRYNTRQVRIDEPALTAIPVGGSFRASNVEAFLRLIERELPLQAIENGRQIVLKGKKPLS